MIVDVGAPGMETSGGENEQIGGIVTSGVIDAHVSVTFPVYPLAGFTLTTPSAPLPATTLLGATAL